ncbi:hypothetical protein F0562_004689 [Nyssa sinensis]|uniref:Uncharacterized protein n=1 Tax=Nyssa sinensis TaxID=561372 RepID=A0A5J5C1N5_9ASTE|nr:hypothetical protein F0562_004689 [Nyssa sinensis]
MGLFTYTIAGGGFVLIGAWESLISTSENLKITPSPPTPLPSSSTKTKTTSFSSSITFIAISLLSFFFILNSLISLIDALNSRDQTGVALQLEGMWFVQMGFSFYSDLMAHGCSLHEKSRGNYTVRCKGHPEYHRGRALATLQFNCHLAFLVVLIAGAFAIISKNNRGRGEFMQYRPLGAEMQQLDNQAQFTLDSDDDSEDGIKEEKNVADQKAVVIVPKLGINGNGSRQ